MYVYIYIYIYICMYVYISTPVFKNIATLKTYIEYICFLFSCQSVSGMGKEKVDIFEI